ncbi:L,D-transpeptidase family protein [Vreelandella alkaliphila]|uniref:Murein L,D-transpeptidase n=1 Tax=Halomonas campaniensis TaxID=213554 RepID=A0A3D0KEF2_9GAMM|nr:MULTISPECIES: L,D-transpeptidase family protein [unclassified Halomonas]WKD29300.1 L,D-transpeptidase family protein [Halomonas sp. KG2]HBS82666.1 murein L,D-transpeptidase [Halomonas campaniensis]HCA01908.1 murein L,D-transpeptidase [Halomonas campaniensis]
MNETTLIRRWAIGVALCLTLIQAPQLVTSAQADAGALEQALAQRLDTQSSALLPVEDFYQQLNQRPVWQDISRVEALVQALNSLEDDGLAPSDYDAGILLNAFQTSQQAGALAQADFDIQATTALLLALEHLSRGKVNPNEVEPKWDIPRPERRYSLLRIAHAVENDDIQGAFDYVRPSSTEYAQLRDALRQYRTLAEKGNVPYLAGRDEALRPGDTNEDVLVLRQRLAYWGETNLLAADSNAYPMIEVQSAVSNQRTYDAELEGAVKQFQRRHQLQEDGVVGQRTRLALNTPVTSRIDQLRVNLERARWIKPTQTNEPRVWVDIAGYRLHYTRPNGEHWDARVVVGTPRRETPIIHSAISHLTINPSWTIPPTIMREDVLPQVRRDPGYLARRNIQVISHSGERLNADAIDWQRPGAVMLRQVSGGGNPLGRVVVRFPNSEMIYLHDTPARGLFQRDQRALSSGCVRVEGVTEFAQLLLQDSGSRYQLSSLLNSSGSDRNVNLPQRIPVALHYLTAWPNAQGEVEFRDDIYRRDADLLAALSRAV